MVINSCVIIAIITEAADETIPLFWGERLIIRSRRL